MKYRGERKSSDVYYNLFYNLLKWWLLISINSIDPSTKEMETITRTSMSKLVISPKVSEL